MADGNLKLLNLYTKFNNLSRYLAQNEGARQFYTLPFQTMMRDVTRLSADAAQLYGIPGQPENHSQITNGAGTLRMNYSSFHDSLDRFRQSVLAQGGANDPQLLQMLQELNNDCVEDLQVMQRLNLQPGVSFGTAVRDSQQAIENERAGVPQQEQALPGQDTLYGQNFPGQNTLYGQYAPAQNTGTVTYPGENTLYGQNTGAVPFPGQNTLYGQNGPVPNAGNVPNPGQPMPGQMMPGQAMPGQPMPGTDMTGMNYPGMNTINLNQGYQAPAYQPWMQQQYYGGQTFYQSQMDLPSADQVKREDHRHLRENNKYLQIWTVAPLTTAIAEQTYRTARPFSDAMVEINRDLQSLYHSIRPFNPPLRGEEQPQMASPQQIQTILFNTKLAYQKLANWQQQYAQSTPPPSEQVLFMTANVMKKLEDDYFVLQNIRPGETFGEAARRLSKLENHYGLENDRKTPTKCPERKKAPVTDPHQAVPHEPPKKKTPVLADPATALTELRKMEKAISEADPKWMLSSSGQYGTMKENIISARKWIEKNQAALGPGADKSSKEYKTAHRKYRELLDTSLGSVVDYLDKKDDDFHKDTNRRDDPGKQKWEQLRIRTALHSFDALKSLRGQAGPAESAAEWEQKAEEYKSSLLSADSAAIFARENAPAPDKTTAPQPVSL